MKRVAYTLVYIREMMLLYSRQSALSGQSKELKTFTAETQNCIFVYSAFGTINKYLDFLCVFAPLRFNLLTLGF